MARFMVLTILSITLGMQLNVVCSQTYNGTIIGAFINSTNEVAGTVYAFDNKRLMIVGLSYDGKGPDAHFWTGKRGETGIGATPGAVGLKVASETGSMLKLPAYANKDVVLTLPGTLQVTEIAWFGIWCDELNVTFGYVTVSASIKPPAMINIGAFKNRFHKVNSADVYIKNTKQLIINSFRYDGGGPDAFFIVGSGAVGSTGFVKVPDENGRIAKKALGYNFKTITLTLPGDKTVNNVDYLAMYCIRHTHNFGEVLIGGTKPLAVPPYIAGHSPGMAVPAPMPNCMKFGTKLNVGWDVVGTDLVVELMGILASDEWMSFGVSGSTTSAVMVGGDVAVAYMMASAPKAFDYNLESQAPCSVATGACPDTVLTGGSSNENVVLIDGESKNGITRIKYKRKLNTGDANDKVIDPSADTSVIWGIGPLRNQKVTKHFAVSTSFTKINFGATTGNSCKLLKTISDSALTPWKVDVIKGDKITTFDMEIGSTGGDRGYTGITGKQSWGIAWYVNRQLIPELILQRGVEYTFNVYGGNDVSNAGRYHPFYITNDPVGGYAQKNAAQRSAVKVFAGVKQDGSVDTNAVGQYCEWVTKTVDQSATINNFPAYFQTLERKCDSGNPGIIKWTPDANTPDVVYYQCYTHNYLGWKIRVFNDIDDYSAAPGNNNNGIVQSVVAILAVAIYQLLC